MASRLQAEGWRCNRLAWPGFGEQDHVAGLAHLDGLVAWTVQQLDALTPTHPVVLLGQSMGSIVAVRVALARPHQVSHLVLAVTSAGVDVSAFGAQDWRAAYQAANPDLPV